MEVNCLTQTQTSQVLRTVLCQYQKDLYVQWANVLVYSNR